MAYTRGTQFCVIPDLYINIPDDARDYNNSKIPFDTRDYGTDDETNNPSVLTDDSLLKGYSSRA